MKRNPNFQIKIHFWIGNMKWIKVIDYFKSIDYHKFRSMCVHLLINFCIFLAFVLLQSFEHELVCHQHPTVVVTINPKLLHIVAMVGMGICEKKTKNVPTNFALCSTRIVWYTISNNVFWATQILKKSSFSFHHSSTSHQTWNVLLE